MDRRWWGLIAVIAVGALAFSACNATSVTPTVTPTETLNVSPTPTAAATEMPAASPASTATPTETLIIDIPTPPPGCDLAVVAKVMDPTAQPSVYDVFIVVRNFGNDPCPPGTQLLDPLPPGVSLSSRVTVQELGSTSPYWSCSGTSCTDKDGIASERSVHFHFKVTVQQKPVTNCARILNPDDTNESNNEKCVTVP